MKSDQTLTILFWYLKSKADSNGFAPIICRISIDGSNEEFSIAHKVHVDHCDIDTKRVKTAKNAKVINSTINGIQSNLETQFTVLKTQHETISPLMLKNAYNNLPVDHKKGSKRSDVKKMPTLLELTDQPLTFRR
ncbi:hypothetical protein DU508_16980 [Pedobacter chinensis]|uniref:Arm DNA-binding domain-containing protein n=1 Tax=Pedobacter chinensis TaxID=2282421 RepID=A0A369PX68_9SPHI|nr:Arm DNA-binding domain-containing protein [Pedobacter chinensis]RDC55269.1 hypothetical protein DU508_16980 [Pedobacter chinensis]